MGESAVNPQGKKLLDLGDKTQTRRGPTPVIVFFIRPLEII